jgi:hypothetical protein
VVEEKWDGWREIEEIEWSGSREKEREGGYPIPGILQSVRKRLIAKEFE